MPLPPYTVLGPGWLVLGWGPGPWTAWGPPGPFQNLSFEVAGASPGTADQWLYTTLASGLEYGVFDTENPEEDFEDGWENDDYRFDALVAAVVDEAEFSTIHGQTQAEGFESEWGNSGYLFAIGGSASGTFDVGTPQNEEDFEEEWLSNEDYLFASLDGETEALFEDDFETDWSNTGYKTDAFDSGDLTEASFDAGGTPVEFEDFEQVRLDADFSALASSATFQSPAHGFSNGDEVTLLTTGTVPGAFQLFKTYFIVSAAADTFQLSLTFGGGAITATDAGVGVHTIHADETKFWTLGDQ